MGVRAIASTKTPAFSFFFLHIRYRSYTTPILRIGGLHIRTMSNAREEKIERDLEPTSVRAVQPTIFSQERRVTSVSMNETLALDLADPIQDVFQRFEIMFQKLKPPQVIIADKF